ncbi:MAG: hypothetical protein KDC16_10700 [Saprospiraceae bacterium]|nr:hypothetical protein [Saprospiraceae bacterium]
MRAYFICYLLIGLCHISNGQTNPEERFYKNLQQANTINDTIASVMSLKMELRRDKIQFSTVLDKALGNVYPAWVSLELNKTKDSVKIKETKIINKPILAYLASNRYIDGIKTGQYDSVEKTLLGYNPTNIGGKAIRYYFLVFQHIALGQRDEAKALVNEMINQLDKEAYPSIQLFTITHYLNQLRTFDEDADEMYNKAINLSLSLNELDDRSVLYTCKLIDLKHKGKIKEAMEYALKAIEVNHAAQNYGNEINGYCNLAAFHQEQGNFGKAYELIAKAKEIVENHDLDSLLCIPEGAKAFAKMNEKKYDEAIAILKNLVEDDRIEFRHKALYYTNIMDCYNSSRKLDSAYVYYQQFIAFDPNNVSGYHDYCKTFIIEHLINQGSYNQAESFMQDAYRDAEAYEDLSSLSYIIEVKAKLLEAKKDYKGALKEYKEHFKLEMDFRNEEKAAAVTSVQLNSDFEKEKEILSLKNEYEKSVLTTQRNRALLIGGGVGLLALLALGFLYLLRKKNRIIEGQNMELSNLNATKDTLFQIIGHDLRKPSLSFRGIGANINYLLEKGDTDRLKKMGSEIEKDAVQFYNLTDNLLNWAAQQKDLIALHPQNVSLHALVQENMSSFIHLSESKNISIINNVDESLSIFADKESLMVIIRNLLDNAIKFSPKDGKIEIKSSIVGNKLRLDVIDNGSGIDADRLNEILSKEFISSTQGTASEKGSGLGLNIVKNLIKKINGEFNVESTVGKGSMFSVLIPT